MEKYKIIKFYMLTLRNRLNFNFGIVYELSAGQSVGVRGFAYAEHDIINILDTSTLMHIFSTV